MTKKNKDLIYQNSASLKPVEKLVEEANLATEDKTRTKSHNEEINAALGAVSGATLGAGIGYAALYFLGTTGMSAAGITSGLAAMGMGAGMVAGIGVAAAPVAILAVGGYAIVAKRNEKKLIEQKEMLLQEVLRKHHGIIELLKKKAEESAERLDYLNKLNTLLQAAIHDLKADLEEA